MHLEPCITAPRQIFLLIQSGVIDQMQPLCACYPLELEQTWGRSVWRHWASVLLWGEENDFSPCEDVMALSDRHHKQAKSKCSESSSSVLSLVSENKAAHPICFKRCTSSNTLRGPAPLASLLWDTWSMKHLSQLSQSLGQVIAVETSHLQIILNGGRCGYFQMTSLLPPPHTHTHLRSRSGDKPLRSRGGGYLASKSMQTVRVQTDRSYTLQALVGKHCDVIWP